MSTYSFTKVALIMMNLELGTTSSNIGLIELGDSQGHCWNYSSDNWSWFSYWTSSTPVTYSTSYLSKCNPGNLVASMSSSIMTQMGKNANTRVTTACPDFDSTATVVYYGDDDGYIVQLDLSSPNSPTTSFSTYTASYPLYAVTTGFMTGQVVFLQSDNTSGTYELQKGDLSSSTILYSFTTAATASPENAYRNRVLDTLIFETTANNFESLVCYLDHTSDYNFWIIDSSGTAIWDFQSATGKTNPYEKFKISPPRPRNNMGNRQIYLYCLTGGSTSNDVCIIDVSYSGSFGATCSFESIGNNGLMKDLDFGIQYGTGVGNDDVYFLDSSYYVSVYEFATKIKHNSVHDFGSSYPTRSPAHLILTNDGSDRYVLFDANGSNMGVMCYYNCYSLGAANGWRVPDTWFAGSQNNTIYTEAAVRMDNGHFLFGGDGASGGQDIATFNTSAMIESNVVSRISGILSASSHEWDFIRVNSGLPGGGGLTSSYLYHYYGPGGGPPTGTGVLIYF